MSLPRPCSTPGCPETTTDGPRCDDHTKGHRRRRRERRGPRPYDRRDYRDRIRPRQLAREPLCRHCREDGRVRPAEEVDHIDGDPTNHDPENLQSLCTPCHSRKTRREQTV